MSLWIFTRYSDFLLQSKAMLELNRFVSDCATCKKQKLQRELPCVKSVFIVCLPFHKPGSECIFQRFCSRLFDRKLDSKNNHVVFT